MVFEDLMNYLGSLGGDPVTYCIFLFIYVILAAVILPLPVEIALFLSAGTPFIVKALIISLGKMIGGVIAFQVGGALDGVIKKYTKWKWFNYIYRACYWLVSKFGYVGLYIILSIPFMSDTVPLYLFSIFKDESNMTTRGFAITCFLAALTRSLIVYVAATFFGIKLYEAPQGTELTLI